MARCVRQFSLEAVIKQVESLAAAPTTSTADRAVDPEEPDPLLGTKAALDDLQVHGARGV